MKQRIVAKHGRLDDLLSKDPNALDKLRAQAAQMTDDHRAGWGVIEYDTRAPSDGESAQNLGWLLVDAVLSRLGIIQFVAKTAIARRLGDVADPLKMLVAWQVIWPDSKLAAIRTDRLYDGAEFDLDQLSQVLDHIGGLSESIQTQAAASVSKVGLTEAEVIAHYRKVRQARTDFLLPGSDLMVQRNFVYSEAYFVICNLAWIVIRSLKRWTGLPSGQLREALRHLQGIDCGQDIWRLSRPVIWDSLDQAIGVSLNQQWATTAQIAAWKAGLADALAVIN